MWLRTRIAYSSSQLCASPDSGSAREMPTLTGRRDRRAVWRSRTSGAMAAGRRARRPPRYWRGRPRARCVRRSRPRPLRTCRRKPRSPSRANSTETARPLPTGGLHGNAALAGANHEDAASLQASARRRTAHGFEVHWRLDRARSGRGSCGLLRQAKRCGVGRADFRTRPRRAARYRRRSSRGSGSPSCSNRSSARARPAPASSGAPASLRTWRRGHGRGGRAGR